MQKQKEQNRTFRVTEEVMEIYRKNLLLQRKLDEIKMRGTGINNVRPIITTPLSAKNASSERPLNMSHVHQINLGKSFNKGHDEIILTQGSLNYLVKKREAQRIDRENFKMAGRISQQPSTVRNGSISSRRSTSSAMRGSSERSPRRVTSKANFQVEKMMQRHRDRISRAFGHFSGISPDPSQVLPKIVSIQ